VPLLAGALLAGTSAAVGVPGPAAAPGAVAALPGTCAGGGATGRVFPEPEQSVGWLRLPDFECGIGVLQEQHPDLIEVTTTGTSKGGHPVYDVLLTDETAVGPKQKLLVVSSIHGDEIGAREGAARVIEELVDPELRPDDVDVDALLDRYVVHFLFPNPDGWVSGDVVGAEGSGLSWTRGNDSGRDLNRSFPVKGWISPANGTLQEPESQGIRDRLLGESGWYLGTDNHGQLHDTYAAAGLQIVGEFDYQKSETLASFADGISASMAQYPVLDQLATAAETGGDVGPYHWGTLYDMLGYSASGSLIDYYNTADGNGGYGFATELTVGKTVAGNTAVFDPVRAKIWVDSIRAINYEMFRQALEPQQHVFPVGGRTAYVFDPEVERPDDADGTGFAGPTLPGVEQQPYEATRMRFFEDLNRYAERPLEPVRVADVLAARTNGAGKAKKGVDLRAFDSVVLADDAMPRAPTARRGWRSCASSSPAAATCWSPTAPPRCSPSSGWSARATSPSPTATSATSTSPTASSRSTPACAASRARPTTPSRSASPSAAATPRRTGPSTARPGRRAAAPPPARTAPAAPSTARSRWATGWSASSGPCCRSRPRPTTTPTACRTTPSPTPATRCWRTCSPTSADAAVGSTGGPARQASQ
jgi:hypothetical protein